MSRPRAVPPHRLGIAELKSRLSEALRWVRSGEAVTVCDRDTPVASIVPVDRQPGGLVVRAGSGRPQDVRLPAPLGDVGGLAALRDERADRS
jgi:antitoxin (DNA-binding transcriptional repressor) of toxin-antitoxin stability system